MGFVLFFLVVGWGGLGLEKGVCWALGVCLE